MKERLAILLVSLLSCVGIANAQTKINGVVTSADDGQPVIGASVMIVGTKIGVVTDVDGKFALSSAKKDPTIVVSYIGMKTQRLKGSQNMKIVLQSDAQKVQEVVVTGMQKMDKRLFTGAATKVSAEKSKLDGVADISRSLEGRAAGVSVQNVSGTFGTAPKIRVRGATSIYGSSKPLWVVDGVIMEDVTEVSADQLSSGDAATLISSAIAGLNADDIESFQILKDGSATSIYGARAMAGVIVVTTKRGKAGVTHINYTGEFTMRLKPSYSQFNIMNSQEQMGIYRQLEANGMITFGNTYRASTSGVYGKMYQLMNTYDPVTKKFLLPNTEDGRYKYLRQAEFRNTNWFDELFSNAISMNHSVSLSSGTERAQYYTSFSIMNDPGWTEQSQVNRYTFSTNALYNMSKHLSLNLIGNAAYRKQRSPGAMSQHVDGVTGAVTRDFDINPYSYAINSSRTLDPNEFYVRNFAPFNIHHELANNYNDYDVIDTKVQAELKYKPITKVELAVLGAYKFSTTTQANNIKDNSNTAMAFRAMDDATMMYSNKRLYVDPDKPNSLPFSILPNGGFYRETKYKMNSWDFRATASYNDVYNNDHIVNLFGGMEINNTDRTSSYFNGVGMQYELGMLPSYDYRYFKQSSEGNELYYDLSNGHSREVSFFGTGTYSWKGRYTINGTVRYEGSNRLGKARSARWLPTWNVSGAWNMHEESWFEKTFKNKLSHATFKASYSLTGDKPATTNAEVIIRSYNPWKPFAIDKESGLEISSFANPDLTYEKKHELNLGVDLGFLNNRLNVAFDWYRRNNYDLIGPRVTNGTKGTTIEFANVASMKSNGEELSISSKNIVTKDFTWNTDFIFSHVNTEVTALESKQNVIRMITGSGFTLKGYPYRSLFSMNFQGLNDRGVPMFINEKGKKTTSDINFQARNVDHLVYEGPVDPIYTGSLGNTFTYKGWRLIIFTTYSFGNKLRLDPAFYSWYSDLDATPRDFKNRWIDPGDEKTTNIPGIPDLRTRREDGYISYAYNAYNRSTARVAKGDFIRMKEISLAYDFPQKWANYLHLAKLNLKLQATNLFLIYADKKLNGQDPEFFNSGGVAVPMARQFTLTLRVGL